MELRIEYLEDEKVNIEISWLGDKEHCENGPAVKWFYKSGEIKCEEYYLNGISHRDNGPAIIEYDRDGSISSTWYYLNNKEITDELQIMVIDTNDLIK